MFYLFLLLPLCLPACNLLQSGGTYIWWSELGLYFSQVKLPDIAG